MRHTLFAALTLTLVGCGTSVPATTSSGSATATPAGPSEDVAGSIPASAPASRTAPATASPTPSPEDPEGSAPPELAGVWRRNFAGDLMLLTIDGTRYEVNTGSGEPGAGRIFVEGDRITFSDSNRCTGTGTYTWTIEEDRLRFTPAGGDPCGRAGFLPDVNWEPLGP